MINPTRKTTKITTKTAKKQTKKSAKRAKKVLVKVAKVGITKDAANFIYFAARGSVWRVARRKTGGPGLGPRVHEIVAQDVYAPRPGFLYFIDKRGDVISFRGGRY